MKTESGISIRKRLVNNMAIDIKGNFKPLQDRDWVHSYVNWLASNMKKYKLVQEGVDAGENFNFTVNYHNGKIDKMKVTR